MTKENLQKAGKSGMIFPSTQRNCEEFLNLSSMPAWAKESILELIENENWEELNDRFYKNLNFGTGGMRA